MRIDPAGVDVSPQRCGGESLDAALDRRDDVEQAGRVVAQRLVDLVDDTQPATAGPRRSATTSARRARGVARLSARSGSSSASPVRSREQAGDLGEHVEHGLAAHLGRMGRDHRRDDEVADQALDRVAARGRRARGGRTPRRGCRAAAASRAGGGSADAVRGGRPRRCWRAATASRTPGSSAVARSIGRWGSVSASDSSGLRPPRRASTARRRTASTRSNTSSPA